tara:strand:+ start:433 stop:981 length:549 start_codon:yes stop_codon:yes gene_type:complete
MGSGGGGSTVTQTSGIDEEFKPYLVDVLSDVTGRYKQERAAGPDAIVAAMDPKQKEALAYQENLARQAIQGTGIYDDTAAMKQSLQNVMGTQLGRASAGGNLGSARSQAAMQGALANEADKFNVRRRKVAMGGVDALGSAGSTMQAYNQQRLDAPHTSAERYFGYLGSAPQQTTKTGGGGGK